MINDALINSEHAVIGAILKDNDSFDNIDLKAHEFFIKSHELIFNEAAEMLGNGKVVDVITVAESLDSKGLLQQVGELKYIGEIVASCVTTRNIKHHAAIIRKAYQLRKIKALSAELNQAADDKKTPEEITELAESSLFNLIENNNTESTMAHVFDAAVEAIEHEDSNQKGVMSGMLNFDRFINGFKKSDLIILAARPSMGKTALAGQIAENVAKKDGVIFFSLEMSKRQLASRMINFHSSRTSKSEAIAHLKTLNLHIDDRPAATLQHIRSQCRRIKRKHGLGMIVIDYLQLMRGTGDNRNQEIGSLSRGLKGLAKEFDIPVLVLSQLNRKLEERANKRPIMSDLRESGEIEQDADLILFIYRDEVYNPGSPDAGLAEVICSKYRNGATGPVYQEFDGKNTRFVDTDRKPESFVGSDSKPKKFSVFST